MEFTDLNQNIELITKCIGDKQSIVIREFLIGTQSPLEAALIYIDGLVKNERVEDCILRPLMLQVNEKLNIEGIENYLIKKYILIGGSWCEGDLNTIVAMIKKGKTAVLINQTSEVILLDTTGGEYRSISEPLNETALSGSREGFVENIDVNISMMKRKLNDSNVVVERLTVGRRSQSRVAIVYISNIIDMDIVNEVRRRISSIDVDVVSSGGKLIQLIEDYPYNIFPQARGTEKPDVLVNNLTEGKLAVLLDGTPHAMLIPSIFLEFFQTVEDYNDRTISANFNRILRFMATFIVITLPSLYLTLIKFNAELIPIKFITPIIQSRIGIALNPFLEIMLMETVVEILREGGLRLPSKIAQTLSLVGGIIIGDTSVKSKIVSPTTLLIVGITVVATFLIPNYDMALAIRVIRFPMLVIANFLGIFGVGLGCFFILVTLCSTDSFGVPYLSFKSNDMEDEIIRKPLWKMNKRPESIPNNNSTRQTDFRNKWGLSRRRKNEESGE